MAKLNFQQSSVSHDSSEIILMLLKNNFIIIINGENICAA